MAGPDATLVDAVLLKAALGDRQLGTTMCYENEQIRVWDVLVQSDERGAITPLENTPETALIHDLENVGEVVAACQADHRRGNRQDQATARPPGGKVCMPVM